MALFDPQNLAAFATLAVLEIVLGIDNLVFISVTAARLPKERQHRARQVGLALALFTRLALLAGIAWIAVIQRSVRDQPLRDNVVHNRATATEFQPLFGTWRPPF